MAEGVPLGPYVLVRRLARGGMAEIFLARREGPEGFSRELVVKRILPHLAADAEFSAMFLEEARIAARLAHPNVVHTYDFGAADGQHYLAMELVRGVDLHALIARAAEAKRARNQGGGLPPALAAKIVSLACEGLAHAHALAGDDGKPLGLVHRDFTPSNVLVSFDGAVKVADFGIAKAHGPKREMTRVGVVKGKRTYLSPEQSRGEALDLRSDIFNVGITLYEALTGAPLFSAKSHQSAMDEILAGRIPNERWLAGTPPELMAILRRALSPNREDRQENALVLRAELEAYLRTTPESIGAPEIGAYVRETMPDILAEDRRGARAAGTVPALTAKMDSGPGSMEEDDTTDVRNSQPPPIEPPQTSFVAVAETPPVVAAPTTQARNRIAVAAVLVLGALAIIAVIAVGITVGGTGSDDVVSTPLTRPLPPPPVVPPPPPHPLIVTPTTPPPPPPRIEAHLHVETRPPAARVFVNGSERGITPLDLAVSPGELVVTVQLAGYLAEESHVALRAGEGTQLVVPMRRAPTAHPPPHPTHPPRPSPTIATGLLTISTTPWSDVYLGSRHLGTTPLANVSLPEGRHTLTLRAPGRANHNVSVTITAGQTTRVRETL